MALDRTRHTGTRTKGQPRRPGSTIVPGTIQAPRPVRWRDRMQATPTGTALDWRRAATRSTVRGV